MSEDYIRAHFEDIKRYARVIEKRLNDDCTLESVLEDNANVLASAKSHGVHCVLIQDEYPVDFNWNEEIQKNG